ncbi:aldo/keto reductase [Nocardia sp. CNY236]|uniref:aldo/keto reductase n=1 Tax=Nocardia sp. CNY236 TaxID=1169152 RepID=UPI0003FAEDAA|nr:aldo/keto reductase [Nocardia sp. CNY236]
MSTDLDAQPAAAAGTFALGGVLPVHRLGFGAMHLTGPGIWGPPKDPDEAVRVLRRVVELGVNFIDTADSYGPFVSEHMIRAALHPYPEHLVIATKAGMTRPGPGIFRPVGRPEYLRQQAELSLRHLEVDRIDLYQLHRIDPRVPLVDQVGELVLLQQEGKIRHIGLSQVTVEQLRRAREIATIVSVQNLYNLADRSDEDVLDYAERENIAFIPWYPIATGELAGPESPLAAMSAHRGATPAQLALAWLLRRSPVMLPIPGTSSVAHAEENVAAARVTLTDSEFEELAALA